MVAWRRKGEEERDEGRRESDIMVWINWNLVSFSVFSHCSF